MELEQVQRERGKRGISGRSPRPWLPCCCFRWQHWGVNLGIHPTVSCWCKATVLGPPCCLHPMHPMCCALAWPTPLQASRRDRSQVTELTQQLAKVQALLKQREAAVAALGQQLDAAKARHSSAGGPGSGPGTPTMLQGSASSLAGTTPKGPLSRQNSDEEALVAELAQKTARISVLESELAAVNARVAALTPRRRDSIEDSGVAAVGSGGSMSAYDANRLRSLRSEVEMWKDRSENLMTQVRELQRQQQARGWQGSAGGGGWGSARGPWRDSEVCRCTACAGNVGTTAPADSALQMPLDTPGARHTG